VLPCLQDYHQPWEGWSETTEEWCLCVGDEAYDCEKDGKATSQGSIVYMGRLSIHFRQHGVQGMGIGDSIFFGVVGLHVLDYGIQGVLKFWSSGTFS
jgi:hypothetical protein